MQAAKIAPPAGPDSTSRTGKRMAVSLVVIPPPEVISKGTAKARTHQIAVELRNVAPDEGLQIGVCAGGGEALVFAHLRRDLAGQRHCEMRQPARNRIADPALVIRIGEAVQQ